MPGFYKLGTHVEMVSTTLLQHEKGSYFAAFSNHETLFVVHLCQPKDPTDNKETGNLSRVIDKFLQTLGMAEND